jgi:exonuclease SbcC
MPVRIHVKNFQSIADAELVVDGFTVVTGANNSGKTALIRAVQGVFTNAPGDAFVRYGADKLSVELRFDDGQAVRWEKGPKVKPTYAVAGKVLHPGRGVPDEVGSLGIRPIQVGQVPVWPQVAAQFSGQVFLLDLPGSSIAEAVADVDRVGRLTQALRYAESDKRAASSDLKVRRQDVESGKQEVEAFAGVDHVVDLVLAAEALASSLDGVVAEVEEAETLRARLASAAGDIARFAGVREVRVPPPAVVAEARRVAAEVSAAGTLRARLLQARGVVHASEGIRDVRVPPSPTEALAARASLAEASVLRDRLRTSRRTVDRLTRVRAALASSSSTTLEENVAKAGKAQKTLEYLEGLRGRVTSARAEVVALREGVRSRCALLAQAEAEVASCLKDLGSCPVCGSVVAGSHVHGA